MSEHQTLYKVLNEDGSCYHGGTLRWSLPRDGAPGLWHRVDGDLIPCQVGLHLCRVEDLVGWLGPTIWIAEARGEHLVEANKVVVREARLVKRITTWTQRIARLFACDCAERVLPIYERYSLRAEFGRR